MNETDARELAAEIETQFPHVKALVVQSTDMRNAPRNWFIAVHRSSEIDLQISLHIHARYEWQDALDALYVLKP